MREVPGSNPGRALVTCFIIFISKILEKKGFILYVKVNIEIVFNVMLCLNSFLFELYSVYLSSQVQSILVVI